MKLTLLSKSIQTAKFLRVSVKSKLKKNSSKTLSNKRYVTTASADGKCVHKQKLRHFRTNANIFSTRDVCNCVHVWRCRSSFVKQPLQPLVADISTAKKYIALCFRVFLLRLPRCWYILIFRSVISKGFLSGTATSKRYVVSVILSVQVICRWL